MKMSRLSPARIARSLVVVMAISFIQTIVAPIFVPEQSISGATAAVARGTITSGTSIGGTGGNPTSPVACASGPITSIAVSASTLGSYTNGFGYYCTSFNNDATLGATAALTTVFAYQSIDTANPQTCPPGKVAIGFRGLVNASMVTAMGLICGNAMSGGSSTSLQTIPTSMTAGTVTEYTCDAGKVLVGFTARTGNGADQVTPQCATYTGFVYAAIGTPSIASSGPHTASIAFTGVTTNIADTALTYTVTAVPTSGTTITATGSSSPIALTGLGSNMAYTITVTGSNSYGTSAATGSVTLSSAPLPDSDTDTALTFNGSSQYLATSKTYSNTTDFTLEAWVKPSDTCTATDHTITNYGHNWLLCNGGSYITTFADSTGNNWTYLKLGVPVRAGEWVHLAVTRSGTTIKAYVNNSPAQLQYLTNAYASSYTQSSIYAVYASQYIGGTGAAGSYFNGSIDEVKVFNTARTLAQISSGMHNSENVNNANLISYYNFNEGSGSTLYNRAQSALANTDMNVSGPTWSTISTSVVNGPYTILTIPRTLITSAGGWRVPSNVTSASVLVVGGGGGGGGQYNSNPYDAGGGGGGGVFEVGRYIFSPNTIQFIKVGTGGLGGVNAVDRDTQTLGYRGDSTTVGALSAGGGGGAGYTTSNQQTGGDGNAGGGGGGSTSTWNAYNAGNSSNAVGALGGTGSNFTIGGVTYSGRSGGKGAVYEITYSPYSGAGGGAGGNATPNASGSSATAAPGTGITSSLSGSSIMYGRGGTSAAVTTPGFVDTPIAPGNGGDGYRSTNSSGFGASGAAGLVIIRWITASVPTYTKPTTAYLNVGMTETFTTNVAQDSATAVLTRNFKWESTTPSANGVYTLIKQGTGAANAAFSWIPTDTSTSGSGYLYRLTVTDSDTAGLFITDSSTAYAVINRALSVVGNSTIAKRINLSKNETFTITLGTSTYRPTLAPLISGISLDTSTAGLAVIKISDTLTVGTYYETLTVTDSVSASVVTPLIIKVAAPPNLLNTSELVSESLALHFEAGNSASLLGESGTVTTGLTWNDLSGSKFNASTGAGVNTNASLSSTCSAPTYSSDNGGALLFKSNDDNCYYTAYNGANFMNNFTVEAWFKTTEALNSNQGLLAQSTLPVNSPVFISVRVSASGGLYVSYWNNLTATNGYPNCPFIPTIGTWTSIAGTYDGTTMSTYINGQLQCSATVGSYSPSGTGNTSGIIIGKLGSGATNAAFPGYIGSVRMYTKALTANQILSNYNATKSRFDTSNNQLVTPTKKYGNSLLESYTATSGLDTKTVTFSIGDRAGIDWDTTTVTNRVSLNMQESLTVGTFYDTMTVTDSLGQSTFMPVKMSVSKADSLTVTISAATTVSYNGSQISVYPRATVTGLKWTDSATSLTRFSSTLYAESTVVPTNADTYTVRGAVPVFTQGSIDNYLGVNYDTSTSTINKVKQSALSIFMYGGVVGLPYYIYLQGGNGTGAVTESLTGVSTLTGCAVNNHYLTASDQKQGFCEVRVVKAGDQNYYSETQTVQLYFMAYVNNQSTYQGGSGSTIGLNGKTSLTIDDSSTVRSPRISGFSKNGTILTINGEGFGSIPVTVIFERYVNVTPAPTPTLGGTVITVTIPGGAISGPVLVITAGGRDSIDWLDLP